jgi:hypothetical protein
MGGVPSRLTSPGVMPKIELPIFAPERVRRNSSATWELPILLARSRWRWPAEGEVREEESADSISVTLGICLMREGTSLTWAGVGG